MKRYYETAFKEFSDQKMILISGPRQAGKTTCSRDIFESHDYLNFDNEEHRDIIQDKSWNRKKSAIIFDELHKKKSWKNWLKGVYDTEEIPPSLIITGSARLDTFRKVGDSMAGRYFSYRLHPFDVAELFHVGFHKKENLTAKEINQRILECSGFPEPFLKNSSKFYNLWKKTHLDIILRQDLIELENVKELKSIELLVSLLRKQVGSAISYSSLSRDLQVSDKTIKRWLELLENMYVIFKLTPFHRNVARSNLKKPKYYFFDTARVFGEGAKIENLVACSLYKYVHYQQDVNGIPIDLNYLSKKGGIEIDFVLSKDLNPIRMIEVKLSDQNLSNNFKTFLKDLPNTKCTQLVYNLEREKTYPDGTEVTDLSNWLSQLA